VNSASQFSFGVPGLGSISFVVVDGVFGSVIIFNLQTEDGR
jgi:hypothetical protein